MNPVVGIFRSSDDAKSAAERLNNLKKPGEEIDLLTPEMAQTGLETKVPTLDAETEGVGRAIGGVVGGAIVLAVASHLGSYLLAAYSSHSAAYPIFILFIIGAGLLGAWLGIKVVGYVEKASSTGVPHDDLFLYQYALQHEHGVVVAMAESDDRAEMIRNTLREMGAESLDTARERWWIGLRSAETEHYEEAEPNFRHGFEAAMNPDFKGRIYGEVAHLLIERYGDEANHEDFRRGYERGQAYARQSESRRAA